MKYDFVGYNYNKIYYFCVYRWVNRVYGNVNLWVFIKFIFKIMIRFLDVFNLCFRCVFIMFVIVLILLICICFIFNFYSFCLFFKYVDFIEKIIILRILEK